MATDVMLKLPNREVWPVWVLLLPLLELWVHVFILFDSHVLEWYHVVQCFDLWCDKNIWGITTKLSVQVGEGFLSRIKSSTMPQLLFLQRVFYLHCRKDASVEVTISFP